MNLIVASLKFSFLVVIVHFLPLSIAQLQETFCVTPNVSDPMLCSKICPSLPCYELQSYINNGSYFTSNTFFIFLPGAHHLSSNLSVHDVENISFIGNASLSQRYIADIVWLYNFDPYNEDNLITYFESSINLTCDGPSAFMFNNVTNLKITNLTIVNCGIVSILSGKCAAVHMKDVNNLYMDGVSVQNSTGFGFFGLNILGISTIIRSSFLANNQFIKENFTKIPLSDFCNNSSGNSSVYVNSGDCSVYEGGNMVMSYIDTPFSNKSLTSLNHSITLLHSIVSLGMDGSYQNPNCFTMYSSGLSFLAQQDSFHIKFFINSAVFYRNQASYGANLYFETNSSKCEVVFHNINCTRATSIYGAIFYQIYLQESANAFPVKLTFYKSVFKCNRAQVLHTLNIQVNDLSNKTSVAYVNINNCYFGESGSTIQFFLTEKVNVSLSDNTFIGVEGFPAVIYIQGNQESFINFNRCHMTYISLIIQNAYVEFNGHTIFMKSTVKLSSTSLIIHGNATFNNSYSTTASGGAINLASSKIYFAFNSQVVFFNNTALYGGALYLDPYSTLFPQSTVIFMNNTSLVSGGAIWIQDDPIVYYAQCPIQVIYNSSALMKFHGNVAKQAGSVLYGGSIDNCCFNNSCSSSSTEFNKILQYCNNGGSVSLISSDATYVCSCESSMPCAKSTGSCDQVHQNLSIYPGESISLSFSTLGQRYGLSPSTVLVYNSSTSNIITALRPENKNCTTVSINSSQWNIPTGGSTMIYLGTDYSISLPSFSLSVYILGCPLGFQFNSTSYTCVCDTILSKYSIHCDVSSHSVQILNTTDLWIGNNSAGALSIYHTCPYQYCTNSRNRNLLVPDSSCVENRTGVLCGQCIKNHSAIFGTSACNMCTTNSNMLLLILFFCLGIVLVTLLILTHCTVDSGVLNGIIFYANIISGNSAIFFPTIAKGKPFLNALYAFTAWLNLDFGIEMCFYDGMTDYIKTWLQFAFPFYLLFLVGIFSFVGRFSSMVSKISRYGAIPVLATLFLLCYSKILENTIAIFSFANLDLVSNNTNKSNPIVWMVNGNIKYCHREHAPLFAFGVLIILFFIIPFTALLVFAPCIQRKSHSKYFRWINRLKPFIDCYQAPFKDKYRFWPGILFALRLPLFALFALPISTNDKMIAVIMFTTIYLLFATAFSVYKKWWHLTLEILFLLNLCYLCAWTLQNLEATKQEVATTISLVIASLCLLLTFIYQVFLRINQLHSYLTIKKVKDIAVSKAVNEYDQIQVIPDDLPREPLLEDT